MTHTARRVVITGVAATTCCGIGVEALFRRLEEGFRYGVRSRRAPPAQAPLKRLPEFRRDTRELARKTRTDHLLTLHLLAAVDRDLGPDLSRLDEETRAETGVVVGNTSGNVQSYFKYYATATEEGYEFVNPVHFPTTLLNYATVQLNNTFSLKGSSTTISSGLSAGLDAIGYAALRLQLGRDHIVLAGAVEELNEYNLSCLMSSEGRSPSGLIRPFDEQRDGTVPAEGLGVLLLETFSQARREGRKMLAEILGYGSSKGREEHGGKDSRQRVVQALEQALKKADVEPDDVDAIFPSANGSVAGDEFEASVLDRVFGSRLKSVPLYPIKSMFGECFTASGPLQCMAAIYAMSGAEPIAEDGIGSARVSTGGLLLPERIAPCRNALVYSWGLDRTFSALVMGRVSLECERSSVP